MQHVLTPELLLHAYQQGVFPMADSADSLDVQWICPSIRGLLPIQQFHVPKTLKKTVEKAPYDVTIDTAFEQVIKACAQKRDNRQETWINDQIIEAYTQLHELGHAHSVECWLDGELVGGIYGLKIGAAFFGESMFSTCRDASKVALVHLTARLWQGGFQLFDTQFVNDHLLQFGVYEMAHEDYMNDLQKNIHKPADFALKGKSEDELVTVFLNRDYSASDSIF